MSKILTQEEIKKEIKKRGYMLMNEYINSSTKIILQDDKGYLYSITWDNFKQDKKPMKFHKSNPYTIQNIKLWMKTNAIGYELLSTEYVNNHDKLLFKCHHSHEFHMCWRDFKQGHRCNICTGRHVTTDNCISTTDSWMIPYFKNKEDVYTHTFQSNDKVPVVCPHCGKEKEIAVCSIYRYKGIGCTCSDGNSYPNKFVYNAMVQVFGIDNVFTEQSFDWSGNRRYDMLIKTQNGDNILIENHGGQHYKQSTRGRSLQEEQENDIYKKELAEKNRFIYIELDCRESNLKYIRNSMLNSRLSNLFDLTCIDWLQCEEYALKNIILEICSYWREHNEINDEGLTTTDISKIFNLGVTTIQRYLNKGVKLEWCNYNGEEEKKKASVKGSKSTGKPVEIFKDGKSLGIFESCSELERQSEDLFGVKLNNSKIASVCRGDRPHHKGFTFRYIN